MKILAIESSCDDTCVAILKDKELYKKLQDGGLENKNNYMKEVIGKKLNKVYENL